MDDRTYLTPDTLEEILENYWALHQTLSLMNLLSENSALVTEGRESLTNIGNLIYPTGIPEQPYPQSEESTPRIG